jgi:hypothetical protein
MSENLIDLGEALHPSDFGVKGVDWIYLIDAVSKGGFPPSASPLLPQWMRKFSYYTNTPTGVHYAVLSAQGYARHIRIEHELSEEKHLIEPEDTVTNTIPSSLSEAGRARLQTIYETTSGILVVLDSRAIEDLSLEIVDNPEVADLGGKALVVPTQFLTLAIVNRVIALGEYDYEQIRHLTTIRIERHFLKIQTLSRATPL